MPPVNFLEAQASNRWRTFFLIFLLTAILVALCLLLEISLAERGPSYRFGGVVPAQGEKIPIALWAFGFSCLYALVSYFIGGRTILFAAGARHADPTSLKEKTFINVAEEVAIAAGLPVPSLWILPDNDLNAFATGRDPAHAAIAVTEGLLDKLSRDELQAVVAHEMGHIRNRDILLMLYVACMLGAMALIVELLLRLSRRGMVRGGGKRDGGGAIIFLLAGLIGWILGRLVAQFVAMAVSREREYLADATSAELTRNPQSLVDALRKIHASIQPTVVAHQATAPLFIDDPRGRAVNEREGKLADLLSTHPPMELRLRRLEQMAFANTKRDRAAQGLHPLTGEAMDPFTK
ncbi:MAG: M48 family metallopeptidase [Bdellovibrionota bacterium]